MSARVDDKRLSEDPILQEIVRRIVEVANPDRIILFGSRARGDARPDSDYDILIIGPSDEKSAYRRVCEIYKALWGLKTAEDIVWITPQEIDDWVNVTSHLITRALREGQNLYERAA